MICLCLCFSKLDELDKELETMKETEQSLERKVSNSVHEDNDKLSSVEQMLLNDKI